VKIPIGIDLGTTISVVAHVTDEGNVEILKDGNGDTLTPSVVYFESAGNIIVGTEAKKFGLLAPGRVVAAIKRKMGTDFSLRFDDISYRPEGISAIVLRALAEAAARELGVCVKEIASVVTVPAYFGTAEREATALAARIAGLETLDLVAEPVAAALSYGVSSEDRGSVLVYDLGGGTFDATVIRLTQDGPQVVAVDGASQLGGLNFDEALGTLLLDRYRAVTGDEDAIEDEDFVSLIYAEAEAVKKKLSRTESASLTVSRGREKAKIGVSRSEFEEVSRTFVEETLTVVDRVIESASVLGAVRPGQVLLTGGSTRIPAIAVALERHLGIPTRLNDPDTAVAKGAAIHCKALLLRSEGTTMRRMVGDNPGTGWARVLAATPVTSVLPRSLGVKLYDSNDPAGLRVFVDHILLANTPLPITAVTATFATIMEGQERIHVELMEQAGAIAGPEVHFNRRIVDGELSGLPEGLPAGSPIDFMLAVGTDGRIECVARERSSGKELILHSYMEGVGDSAETEAQCQAIAGLKVRN